MKFSSHELVFDKTARIPTSDSILPSDLSKTYADYLTSLFDRLRDSQEKSSAEQNKNQNFTTTKNVTHGHSNAAIRYTIKRTVKGKLVDQ